MSERMAHIFLFFCVGMRTASFSAFWSVDLLPQRLPDLFKIYVIESRRPVWRVGIPNLFRKRSNSFLQTRVVPGLICTIFPEAVRLCNLAFWDGHLCLFFPRRMLRDIWIIPWSGWLEVVDTGYYLPDNLNWKSLLVKEETSSPHDLLCHS